MRILVLDTIHGGEEIARHLIKAGHKCDMADIYRHEGGISEDEAKKNTYDLIAAPVHTDPANPLLNFSNAPVITHHQAAAMIIKGLVNSPDFLLPDKKFPGENIKSKRPHLSVEITGSRGKTTTAFALSNILPGRGILHTSKGTFKMPEHELVFKKSITPASAIDAAALAHDEGRWLIAEESLGVCGFSDLCILTSDEDYLCAAKKKSALLEKAKSLSSCRRVLLAPGVFNSAVSKNSNPGKTLLSAYHAEDFASAAGSLCRYSDEAADEEIISGAEKSGAKISGEFENPLLLLEGYKEAIITAAAAGCILGISPDGLFNFTAVEGRMSVSFEDAVCIVDNSNSGVNKKTAVMAAEYAEKLTGRKTRALVIGAEEQNICEGFSSEDVLSAVKEIKPGLAVIIGEELKKIRPDEADNTPLIFCDTLEEGRKAALKKTSSGSIVLCVKTWR